MHMTAEHSAVRLEAVMARAHASPTGRSPAPCADPPALPPIASSAVDEDADPAGDKRRSPRVAVDAEVSLRRIGSFNYQVQLRDLSAGGCRVELVEQYEPDDDLVARFPDLEPLGALVRWKEGGTAGIKFTTGFHVAVLDSLLERLSSGAENVS